MRSRCALNGLVLVTALASSPAVAVSLQAGWPQLAGGRFETTPVLADLDQDGNLEVIACPGGGWVCALRADGAALAGWPQETWVSGASSPVVADLDGDGDPEVLVATGYGVRAFHGDGTSLAGWPQPLPSPRYSPSVGDVDGDGGQEVVSAEWGAGIYVWHHDGVPLPGWPGATVAQSSDAGIWSMGSAALGDLDGTGGLEIVVGSADGCVYALRADVTPVPGWPKSIGAIVAGAPALGDLDEDGELEVVAGSGDGSVYAWRGDGTPLTGWPQSTGSGRAAYPVLGDIDGDGGLEVVAGCSADSVYAWNGDGTLLSGWPQATDLSVSEPPALTDVDGDDLPEVITADGRRLYAWHSDGTPVDGWPFGDSDWPACSSPSLADLDGDGYIEVAVGAYTDGISVWECDQPSVDTHAWPMPRHDAQHMGRYVPLFADIPADFWAHDEIAACFRAGIAQGYWDGTYRPGLAVTRDQMAVYVARALVMPSGDSALPDPGTSPSFTDVPEDYWAFPWIEFASGEGVVQGYPGGAYHPEEVVSRGQMATYIARAIAAPTGEGSLAEFTPPADPTFPDVTASNEWAWCRQYVEYCAAANVVRGYWDGNYRPSQAVTRDQMAVYLARAFDLPTYGASQRRAARTAAGR